MRRKLNDINSPEYQSTRSNTTIVRIAVAITSIVLILLLVAISSLHISAARSSSDNSPKADSSAKDATPEVLEHSDGYRPAEEIAIPHQREGDHVIRILKSEATDKYVFWTTGSEHATTLTVPGARFGSSTGNSVTIRIVLRHKAAVVDGTPYINPKGVVDAHQAGLVGDGATNNTARFNVLLQLLPKNIVNTVSFPAGHFAFTGVLSMISNLNIIGQHDKTFVQMPTGTVGGMVIWYPTNGAQAYNGMHDVAWKNITFRGDYRHLIPSQTIYQAIIHANNITFDACTFDMVQRPYGHVLDVDGSSGVRVSNSTVIGSPNRGQTFKEAFQMDVAALGASGYYDKHTVFNNLPTINMTIEHNRFLPLRSKSGRLLLPAAAPFGTHMAYAKTTNNDSYIRFGTFSNNIVEDPVAYEGAGTENSAVIHFDAANDITISNNTFIWTGETPQPSWAVAFYARSHRMVIPSGWHGITITNNKFEGFAPKRGAFELYRDRGSISAPGPSISDVTIAHNTFEGTPRHIALQWLHEYSQHFIVTYDQEIHGHDNTVNNTIHLDHTTKH
ncbi:MAG: glycoside hydrolase family 55 protein [Bifidobacterium sp.]|jgi:hypothetical protein|nr:glycoside hydrolase family 55 protein [Bifidobacterium sp.]